jgi:hypothetical protein
MQWFEERGTNVLTYLHSDPFSDLSLCPVTSSPLLSFEYLSRHDLFSFISIFSPLLFSFILPSHLLSSLLTHLPSPLLTSYSSPLSSPLISSPLSSHSPPLFLLISSPLSSLLTHLFNTTGFILSDPSLLPPTRKYNSSRGSKVYIKVLRSQRDIDAEELLWNV